MLIWFISILLYAAPVIVLPGTQEIQLKIQDLEFYEDAGRQTSFDQVVKPDFQPKFNKHLNFVPQDYNTSSAYWVKVKLVIPKENNNYLIEFFDQTIDSLNVFIKHPGVDTFNIYEMGDMYPFNKKQMAHKNFEIQLPGAGDYLIYFRVVSHEYADIRMAIRSYNHFVKYALAEYYLLRKQEIDTKYTLYKDANHNSWDSAFEEPQLLSWLFSNIQQP